MKTVVSTKTLSPILRNQLEVSGLRVLDYDFISIAFINFKYTYNNAISIFTSTNAVKGVLLNDEINQIIKNKCCCVGDNTKAFLEENGFEVLFSAQYAADLIKDLKPIVNTNDFVFFSGNLRRNTIPSFFKEHNKSYIEIQTYRTALTPIEIKEKIDAVLFFSPSAVDSFFSKNKIKNQPLFCIGNTTAEKASEYSKNTIVAHQTTQLEVVKQVESYFLTLEN